MPPPQRQTAPSCCGLKDALADDSWSIEPAGDPIAAINGPVAQAAATLVDVSAIRVELAQLESALPNDPGAAIGKAKNPPPRDDPARAHRRRRPPRRPIGDRLVRLLLDATATVTGQRRR